ncbi:MAG: molybdopterin-dependent oxidoreductase [Thermoplasmatota archaeon]
MLHTLLPGWDGGNVQGLLMAGCLPEKDGRDPVRDMSGLKALYLTQPVPGIPDGVETIVLQDVYTSELLDRADVVLPAASFTEEAGTMHTLDGARRELRPCTTMMGQSRRDWAILAGVAAALNLDGFGYDSVDAVAKDAREHIAGRQEQDREPRGGQAGRGDRPGPDGSLQYRGHDIAGLVPDFARLIKKWRDDDA